MTPSSSGPASGRTLYLLRHAKSSWSDPAVRDHDRPLNGRGRRSCEVLAHHLQSQRIRPHQILVSSARRTRETLELLVPPLGWDDIEIDISDSLYAASADSLLDRVRATDDMAKSLLLVGHNPAIQDLAILLSRRGRIEFLDQIQQKYPTGAFARLRFEAQKWRDILPASGSLDMLLLPRRLEHREKARRWDR